MKWQGNECAFWVFNEITGGNGRRANQCSKLFVELN